MAKEISSNIISSIANNFKESQNQNKKKSLYDSIGVDTLSNDQSAENKKQNAFYDRVKSGGYISQADFDDAISSAEKMRDRLVSATNYSANYGDKSFDASESVKAYDDYISNLKNNKKYYGNAVSGAYEIAKENNVKLDNDEAAFKYYGDYSKQIENNGKYTAYLTNDYDVKSGAEELDRLKSEKDKAFDELHKYDVDIGKADEEGYIYTSYDEKSIPEQYRKYVVGYNKLGNAIIDNNGLQNDISKAKEKYEGAEESYNTNYKVYNDALVLQRAKKYEDAYNKNDGENDAVRIEAPADIDTTESDKTYYVLRNYDTVKEEPIQKKGNVGTDVYANEIEYADRMTEQQKKVFLETYNVYGKKAAAEYFEGIIPAIKNEIAREKLAGMNTAEKILYGFQAGLENSIPNLIKGIETVTGNGRSYEELSSVPVSQLVESSILNEFSQNGGKGKLYSWLNQGLNTTGNMIPSIIVGRALGAALTGAGVAAGTAAKIAGAAANIEMGLQATGASHDTLKRENKYGVSDAQINTYAVLDGALESLSEWFLGSVQGISGGYTKKAVDKLFPKMVTAVDNIRNGFIKGSVRLLGEQLGESMQEELQNYIEPFLQYTVLGEKNPDMPSAGDWLDTLVTTFVSTGLMNGIGSYSGAYADVRKAKNDAIEKIVYAHDADGNISVDANGNPVRLSLSLSDLMARSELEGKKMISDAANLYEAGNKEGAVNAARTAEQYFDAIENALKKEYQNSEAEQSMARKNKKLFYALESQIVSGKFDSKAAIDTLANNSEIFDGIRQENEEITSFISEEQSASQVKKLVKDKKKLNAFERVTGQKAEGTTLVDKKNSVTEISSAYRNLMENGTISKLNSILTDGKGTLSARMKEAAKFLKTEYGKAKSKTEKAIIKSFSDKIRNQTYFNQFRTSIGEMRVSTEAAVSDEDRNAIKESGYSPKVIDKMIEKYADDKEAVSSLRELKDYAEAASGFDRISAQAVAEKKVEEATRGVWAGEDITVGESEGNAKAVGQSVTVSNDIYKNISYQMDKNGNPIAGKTAIGIDFATGKVVKNKFYDLQSFIHRTIGHEMMHVKNKIDTELVNWTMKLIAGSKFDIFGFGNYLAGRKFSEYEASNRDEVISLYADAFAQKAYGEQKLTYAEAIGYTGEDTDSIALHDRAVALRNKYDSMLHSKESQSELNGVSGVDYMNEEFCAEFCGFAFAKESTVKELTKLKNSKNFLERVIAKLKSLVFKNKEITEEADNKVKMIKKVLETAYGDKAKQRTIENTRTEDARSPVETDSANAPKYTDEDAPTVGVPDIETVAEKSEKAWSEENKGKKVTEVTEVTEVTDAEEKTNRDTFGNSEKNTVNSEEQAKNTDEQAKNTDEQAKNTYDSPVIESEARNEAAKIISESQPESKTASDVANNSSDGFVFGGTDVSKMKYSWTTESENLPKFAHTFAGENKIFESDLFEGVNKKNSLGTYHKMYTARAIRDGVMIQNGFTEEQVKNSDKFFDEMGKFMKDMGVTYRFIGLDDVENAKFRYEYNRDGSIKSVIMSAMVKNGEYPVNFDFTAVCTQRKAMQELMTKILQSDKIDAKKKDKGFISLSQTMLFNLGQALRESGCETACLGCFVEAKRFNVRQWVDKFCKKWNSAVLKENPNATYFNYGNPNVTIEDVDISRIEALADDVENYSHSKFMQAIEQKKENVKKGFEENGYCFSKWTAKWKENLENDGSEIAMSILDKKATEITLDEAYWMIDNRIISGSSITNKRNIESLVGSGKEYQQLLRPSDLLTVKGMDALRELPYFYGVLYQHYGSGTPKPVQGFSPYNSEVELLPAKKGKMSASDYLASIAGVRFQSFSDFQVQNVFDYIQFVGGLAARGFTSHGYTKKLVEAQIFGLTGKKYNLSAMFDVDKSLVDRFGEDVATEYAGLTPYDPKVHKGEYAKVVLESDVGGEHIKWVYNVGDYNMQKAYYEVYGGDKRYIQSVDFAKAVALEMTEGYSKNVGIIGVALSDNHLRAMLNDNRIRYVIPYHRSALPSEISAITALMYAKNYEPVQNNLRIATIRDNGGVVKLEAEDAYRMLKNIYREFAGSKTQVQDTIDRIKELVAEKKITLKKSESGHGKYGIYEDLHKTKNPETTAYNYCMDCLARGRMPIFYDMYGDKNFYKLVFDFNVKDCLTEEYAPQEAVKNVYPVMKDGTVVGQDMTEDGFDATYLKSVIEKEMIIENEMGKVIESATDKISKDVISNPSRYDGKNFKYGNEENARHSVTESVVTPAEDAEYLELAKEPEKNEEKLRSIIKYAARKAGYNENEIDSARKTLAPVTYDDNGNIIPLSERFNPNNDDTRYSYTGESSELDNRGLLADAIMLENEGKKSEEIRKATGWFRGMDGLWRYEIDDSKANLLLSDDEIQNGKRTYKLKDVLDHEMLYKAYPFLQDIDVKFSDLGDYELGNYNEAGNEINLSDVYLDLDSLKETLLHEIQHAIQKREGFTKGSSIAYWNDKLNISKARMKMLQNDLKRNDDILKEAGYYDYEESLNEDAWNEKILFDDIDGMLEEWVYNNHRELADVINENKSITNELRKIGVIVSKTARDLYFATAGEIEASDTGKRRNLPQDTEKNNIQPSQTFSENSVNNDKMSVTESPVSSEQELTNQITELKKRNDYLFNRIIGIQGNALDETKVKKQLREIMDRYQSKADGSRVYRLFKVAYDYMRNGALDGEFVDKIDDSKGYVLLADAIDDIFDNIGEYSVEESAVDAYKQYRKSKIFVSDDVIAEFDNWNRFRKSTIGILNIVTDPAKLNSSTPVDSLYLEMSGLYPELFDPSIENQSDQLRMIVKRLSEIHEDMTTVQSTIEPDFEFAVKSDLANDMIELLYTAATKDNDAKRFEHLLNVEKEKYRRKEAKLLNEVAEYESGSYAERYKKESDARFKKYIAKRNLDDAYQREVTVNNFDTSLDPYIRAKIVLAKFSNILKSNEVRKGFEKIVNTSKEKGEGYIGYKDDLSALVDTIYKYINRPSDEYNLAAEARNYLNDTRIFASKEAREGIDNFNEFRKNVYPYIIVTTTEAKRKSSVSISEAFENLKQYGLNSNAQTESEKLNAIANFGRRNGYYIDNSVSNIPPDRISDIKKEIARVTRLKLDGKNVSKTYADRMQEEKQKRIDWYESELDRKDSYIENQKKSKEEYIERLQNDKDFEFVRTENGFKPNQDVVVRAKVALSDFDNVTSDSEINDDFVSIRNLSEESNEKYLTDDINNLADKIYNKINKPIDEYSEQVKAREYLNKVRILADAKTRMEYELFGSDFKQFREDSYPYAFIITSEAGKNNIVSISEAFEELTKFGLESNAEDNVEKLEAIVNFAKKNSYYLDSTISNTDESKEAAIKKEIVKRIKQSLSGKTKVKTLADKAAEAKQKRIDWYQTVIESKDAKMQGIVEKYESRLENISKAQASKICEKYAAKITDMVAKSSDKNHVPASMRGSVIAFLKSLDFSYSGRDVAKTAVKIDNLMQGADILSKTMGDNGLDPSLAYDMEAFQSRLKRRHITNTGEVIEYYLPIVSLNTEELKNLSNILRRIIFNANKINDMYKNGSEYLKLSDDGIYQIQLRNKLKDKSDGIYKPVNILTSNMIKSLDAANLFDIIGIDSLSKLYDAGYLAMNKEVSTIRTLTYELKKVFEDGVDEKWRTENIPIKLENGRTIYMTKAAIMNFYWLMQQEDSKQDILSGGIIPARATLTRGEAKQVNENVESPVEKIVRKIPLVGNKVYDSVKNLKYAHYAQDATTLTDNDIQNIMSHMDGDMKSAVNGMQRVMQMAADMGNDVSLKMDGFKRFTIRNYIPIMHEGSAKTEDGTLNIDKALNSSYERLVQAKDSFIKERSENRGKPVLVTDVFSVVENHIAGMAHYIGYNQYVRDFVTTLNIKKGNNASLEDELRNNYGGNVIRFIKEFVNDVQRVGAVSRDNPTISEWLLHKTKRGSVAINLSTALKQPLSIFRAYGMFGEGAWKELNNPIVRKADTEEMIRENGIAQLKAWGHSDFSGARSVNDLYNANAKEDKSAFLSEMADVMTWTKIWNACKADTFSMEEARQKFFDVITKTQVVYSAFSTSQIVKNPAAQWLFAFRQESLKSYAYMLSCLTQAKNHVAGSAKKLGLAVVGTALSFALERAITSLFSVIRDKDDDDAEEFLEKFVKNFKEGILLDFITDNLFQIVGDTVNAFKGEEIDRLDTQYISRTVTDIVSLYNQISGKESTKYTLPQLMYNTIVDGSKVIGLPIGNIIRDIKGAVTTSIGLVDNPKAHYEYQKLWIEAGETTKNAKFFKDMLKEAIDNADFDSYSYIAGDLRKYEYSNSFFESVLSNSDMFFNSYLDGSYKDKMNQAAKAGITSDEYVQYARTTNDSKITEASKAYLEGNTEAYNAICDELVKFNRGQTESFVRAKAVAYATDKLKDDVKELYYNGYKVRRYDEILEGLLDKYKNVGFTKRYIERIAKVYSM